jgi:hypothetical protein
MMARENPTSELLRAVRRKGNEAQLTQIIAAFASSDPKFAAGVARCLVDKAKRPLPDTFGPIPEELDCEPEHHAFDEAGKDLGFVDLSFTNAAEGFTLLVELKLHSGYGYRQLERYRDSLDTLGERSALIAATTWLPAYGEDEVSSDRRWLGSVRWAEVFDALKSVEHSDPVLRQLWPDLLNVVRDQGDFGVMTIDRNAVEGWARWQEGRRQMVALLEEIHVPTLSLIRHELARRRGVAVTEDLATERRHKSRLVWPWADSLHIEYKIPPGDGERFRIQFAGGQDKLYFTVEARHGDNRVMRRATDDLVRVTSELEARGFRTGHYWGSYWAALHPVEEWIDDPTISQALLRLVEKDLHTLVESGIFEVLADIPEAEFDHGEPPAEAEDPDA